jgi:peptidoglycan hydrolase CwlO-like protein
MKDILTCTLFAALCFYAGSEFNKKEVVKIITKKEINNKQLIETKIELETCIVKYDELVDKANHQIKELQRDKSKMESEIQSLEYKIENANEDFEPMEKVDKMYEVEEVLEPETVEELEPEMEEGEKNE